MKKTLLLLLYFLHIKQCTAGKANLCMTKSCILVNCFLHVHTYWITGYVKSLFKISKHKNFFNWIEKMFPFTSKVFNEIEVWGLYLGYMSSYIPTLGNHRSHFVHRGTRGAGTLQSYCIQIYSIQLCAYIFETTVYGRATNGCDRQVFTYVWPYSGLNHH